MSPKIPSLTAGLTVLGLLWSATRAPAAEDPRLPAPAESPAPSPTVLMLSNGEVFAGEIASDDECYVIRTKIGEIRYPRSRVEKTFTTIREAYLYKKRLTPERDPDERMKLAQWCLAHKLHTEAQEQLQAVLDLSPDHAPAKAMLFQILASRSNGTRDEGVVQASAAPEPPGPASPAPLNLNALREAARTTKAMAIPVIFNLPRDRALKRYQEFVRSIHPQLQRRCIQCHTDPKLAFQLIPAPTRRDMANDLILRANLEAVLRLVDPEDPAHSELLSVLLMPHKPANRPLLPGPNSPTYRELAAWVQALQARSRADDHAASSRRPSPYESLPVKAPAEEGFALDRADLDNSAPLPSRATTRKPAAASSVSTGQRMPDGYAGILPPNPPKDLAFPTAPLQGAPEATGLVVRGAPGSGGAPAAVATPSPRGNAPRTINVPGQGEVPVDTRATSKADPEAKAAKERRKNRNIDPAALDKFLTKRPGSS